jgi:hypothetical protein
MFLPNDMSKDIISFVTNEFENGKGLRSTALKGYSGPSLERTSQHILTLIITDLQTKYPEAKIELSKKYIKPDNPKHSDERVDKHLYVNGLIVYLEEDRAWMDKPFYSLKRVVCRSILVNCASKVHPMLKFISLVYCLDIQPEIVASMDNAVEYGDIFSTYSITNRSRHKELNWYDTGFDENAVLEYANAVYIHLTEVLEFERNKTSSRRLSGTNEPNTRSINQYDLV